MLCDELAVDPKQQPQLRKVSKRMLIVEDDQDQVSALAHRFENCDFHVLTASSGKQAVESIRSHHFDIILLDIGLPDIDGLTVCSELSDDARTYGVPIVIVSATDNEDIVRQSRLAGGRFFVRKPYDPNVLLLIVESAIAEGT